MEMKRFGQLLLLLCLCSLCAMAQDEGVWILSGKVTDAKTHKAMPHVSVTDWSSDVCSSDLA